MVKKFLSLLSLVLLIGISFSLETKNVNAAALRLEHPTNVYYSRYGGGGPYASNPFTVYYLDGHLGYCIEPGKEIYSYEYKGNLGMTSSPYSDSVNKLIQLIGYYGYEYPGHNTLRYHLATQALIWEKVSGQTVRYYTERYDEGQEIIVTPEKNEIMRLVNSHTLKPSFANSKIYEVVGGEYVLEDTNKVLSMFSVTDSAGHKVKIEGNKLKITPTKAGTSTITLKKAKYDNVSTMVFSPSNGWGQKMAILRFSDEVAMQITLVSRGYKLKVQKVDLETGNVIKFGGIKFKLKDLKTDKYVCENSSCTFTTSTDGSFTTNTYLFGDYELEEVDDMIEGYLWNPSKVKIHIDDNTKVGSDGVLEIKFSNKRVGGKLIINKVGENIVVDNDNVTLKEMPLSNVKFALYANDDIYSGGVLIYKKGTLVKILVTDSKGQVEVSNLYLGKYYLLEIETPKGYILDKNKYEFDFYYKDQYTEVVTKTLDLKNYLKKGSLEINKIGETLVDGNYQSIKLPNIKFNLYANEDIYLNNTLIYQKGSLVKTLTTNKDGYASLNDLLLGKYYLIEAETPKEYIKDTKKYEFEITSDNYNTKNTFTLKNYLKKGSVVINKIGEKLVIDESDYHYESIPLPNIKFNLYANEDIYLNNTLIYKKGSLIKTLTTNNEGYLEITNLCLGNYFLMESETNSNYVLDDTKYEFELTEKDNQKVITFEITNFLKKGELKFLKIDSSNGNPLPDTLIEIYKEEGDEPILIYRGYTDLNGEINLKNLPLGKYMLIEVESSKGYVLSNETFYFDITHDKDSQSITMKNDKYEEIEVPSTGLDSSLFLKLAGLACLMGGIFIITYAKKQNLINK